MSESPLPRVGAIADLDQQAFALLDIQQRHAAALRASPIVFNAVTIADGRDVQIPVDDPGTRICVYRRDVSTNDGSAPNVLERGGLCFTTFRFSPEGMRRERLLVPVYEQTYSGIRPVADFTMEEASLVLGLLTELAVAQVGDLPDLYRDYTRIGPPPLQM